MMMKPDQQDDRGGDDNITLVLVYAANEIAADARLRRKC